MSERPDRRTVELTAEVAAEQERMDQLAMRARYYLDRLGEWDIPDAVAYELVRDWHSDVLSYDS